MLIIALSITQCSKQTIKYDTEQVFKHAIEYEKNRVIDLQNREQVLFFKVKQDSLKNILVVIALKSENKALKAEVKKSKTLHVEQVINDNPDVDKFVDLQDSLINNLDRTIDTLEVQKVKAWASFNNILSIQEEKYNASQEINKHYKDLNDQVSKHLKKEIRRKTFFKVTTGIVATILLFEVIKD